LVLIHFYNQSAVLFRGSFAAMNTSSILALAFCIGVIAGLRSLTAPAVVCWAAHFGWINLYGSRLSFMAAAATAVIFTILALAELATDKHPDAPIRTTLGLLTARLALGALSGAALGVVSHSLALGAVFGAIGAIFGAFGGHGVRDKIVRALHLRDLWIAPLEDVIAIAGGLLIVYRF
jgi:uncharacterized membrane protein